MSYKDKFTLVTFIFIFITYNVIGYCLDIEMLKIVIIEPDHSGMSVSLVALFVPLILSYVIYYFTNKISGKQ